MQNLIYPKMNNLIRTIRLHFTCFSLLLFALTQVVSAQEKNEISELEKQALTIKNIPTINKGNSRIALPKVPKGYSIELKGTDREQVVSRNGEIFTPLVDVDINLYYQLTDNKTSEKTDIPNIKITIAGKHRINKNANKKPNIIPELREWLGAKGYHTFKKKGNIIVDSKNLKKDEISATLLAQDLKCFDNYDYSLESGKENEADIFLTLNTTDQTLGNEGYRLTIGKHIRLEAKSTKGLFMGTRTILQLVNLYGNNIPKGTTRDYPKYRRRGFMIDVGRKFFSIDYLRNYVKIMSYYKMNEFHIHLNDNIIQKFSDKDWENSYSAFRIECDTYPGLTAKDGSYSKKEFIELQKLGANYGINIIPEIDVPAHSLAFTHYRPDLASKEYGMDHLDINNPDTYTFLDALFDEYLKGDEPVFIGPDVHIGTDEYDKKEAESFRKFTNHYLKKVQSYGKRARLWGSLTHADGKTPVTSDNVIMNAWYNGYADPQDMIDQGYELISTSDRHLYIVPAAGYYYDYLNLEFLFNKWEPNLIGGDTFPLGHPQISGGMFAVWNDHCGNGISEKDVHHRCYPALQVMAQKMWQGYSSELSLNQFNKFASNLEEAPFVNLMGKIKHTGEYVLKYDFTKSQHEDISGNGYNLKHNTSAIWNGKTGYQFTNGCNIELPVEEIGYAYQVAFDIVFSNRMKKESVVFSSKNAEIIATHTKGKIKLGFKRENYFYQFETLLDTNKELQLAIKGDNKGTSLFINNVEVERLEGIVKKIKNDNGKTQNIYIQQTLVFPLRTIGNFEGSLKNLSVKFID